MAISIRASSTMASTIRLIRKVNANIRMARTVVLKVISNLGFGKEEAH